MISTRPFPQSRIPASIENFNKASCLSDINTQRHHFLDMLRPAMVSSQPTQTSIRAFTVTKFKNLKKIHDLNYKCYKFL